MISLKESDDAESMDPHRFKTEREQAALNNSNFLVLNKGARNSQIAQVSKSSGETLTIKD